jgi:hypothetical protein
MVQPSLEDIQVPIRYRLAALWTSTMFLFAYGDIIGFFRPGTIEEVMSGKIFVFNISQGFLLGISAYILIPSVMVFLSLVLKPRLNRMLNIIFGIIYILTAVGSAIGDEFAYYYFLSIAEGVLLFVLVRTAWKWPRISTPE